MHLESLEEPKCETRAEAVWSLETIVFKVRLQSHRTPDCAAQVGISRNTTGKRGGFLSKILLWTPTPYGTVQTTEPTSKQRYHYPLLRLLSTHNTRNTMADNPSVRMTPQDNPVKYVKNRSKTEGEGFAETLEWCRRASQLEHCPRLSGGTGTGDTECTCLYALRPQVEGQDSEALCMATRWSCYIASLDNDTRRSLEIEWIKHANVWAKEHCNSSTKRTGYLLQIMAADPSSDEAPPLAGEANVQPLRACKHALMLVLGIGSSRWASSATHARKDTFPVHGLKGKAGNKGAKKKARVDSDLRDFFEKLQDEAEVPATRLVRELTGIGLRAGEEEKIELPTHMTKRGLYRKFCWERGWKLVSDSKGKYTRTHRPYDTEFPEGSEREEIGAWSSFEKYWKEKYPNIKIRASSENICSECHIVAIRYKIFFAVPMIIFFAH
jgi:hypothetical protein